MTLDSFCAALEAALPKEFEARETGVTVAGRPCALTAAYSITSERKMFGLMSTGVHNHSHEHRMVFSAPVLNAETVADWHDWAALAVREGIQPSLDRAHEFSIFTFILLVDRIEKDGVKALKRADRETQYKEPAAGWSQARFVVVDAETHHIYASPAGKLLEPWLKQALKG